MNHFKKVSVFFLFFIFIGKNQVSSGCGSSKPSNDTSTGSSSLSKQPARASKYQVSDQSPKAGAGQTRQAFQAPVKTKEEASKPAAMTTPKASARAAGEAGSAAQISDGTMPLAASQPKKEEEKPIKKESPKIPTIQQRHITGGGDGSAGGAGRGAGSTKHPETATPASSPENTPRNRGGPVSAALNFRGLQSLSKSTPQSKRTSSKRTVQKQSLRKQTLLSEVNRKTDGRASSSLPPEMPLIIKICSPRSSVGSASTGTKTGTAAATGTSPHQLRGSPHQTQFLSLPASSGRLPQETRERES